MSRIVVSFFALAAVAGAVTLSACSGGQIAVGKTNQELLKKRDGSPTGDGTSCAWDAVVAVDSATGQTTTTPPGYGPYTLGEEFRALDGCNDCECTDKGIMCTVRTCAGGNSGSPPAVCRDIGRTCANGAPARQKPDCQLVCPEDPTTPSDPGGPIACPAIQRICKDGSNAKSIPGTCDQVCPEDGGGTACDADAFRCPDGTTVGRTGPKCEFVCPSPVACPADAKLCPDGSYVVRKGPTCQFPVCEGGGGVCADDVKQCPNGSYVSRQGPNCEFAPCP